MKHSTRLVSLAILLALALVIVVGCSTPAPTLAPTLAPSPIPPTNTPVPPTSTSTPLPPTNTPAPTATSTPTNTPTPTLAPNALPPVPSGARSGNSSTKVALVIDNYSSQTLTVFWVDSAGNEKSYGTVTPMNTFNMSTYQTHVWRLRDAAGKEVATYVMNGDETQRIQIQANGQGKLWKNDNPCKLPVATSGVNLGFPPSLSRFNPVGTARAKVLFVDFADAPAQQSPSEIFSIFSPGAPDYYKAVSYGRMNFQLEPHLVWLRMSKSSGDYNMARGRSFATQRAFNQEAVDLADPAVDFAGVQAIYVIPNPKATAIPSASGGFIGAEKDAYKVDGNTIYAYLTTGVSLPTTGYRNINHEVGHTMGLVDFYLDSPVAPLTTHSMVGMFSLMGYNFADGKAPEYLAYERWNLGWLDDNQIVCQTANDQTTTLTPIETAGGVKAVVIPTGKTSAVVVESRRALGYDNKIAKPGALVYTIDTAIKTGEGPVKVVPVIDGDAMRDQSPRAVGESVTVGNVTIKVTAADANGDTVQVTVAK